VFYKELTKQDLQPRSAAASVLIEDNKIMNEKVDTSWEPVGGNRDAKVLWR